MYWRQKQWQQIGFPFITNHSCAGMFLSLGFSITCGRITPVYKIRPAIHFQNYSTTLWLVLTRPASWQILVLISIFWICGQEETHKYDCREVSLTVTSYIYDTCIFCYWSTFYLTHVHLLIYIVCVCLYCNTQLVKHHNGPYCKCSRGRWSNNL